MIKVFFCIAKEKIANPNGKLYIILLGTDQLETSFGILHTIIGNDANADILQLTTRLSHISEIQNILTSNLSWDHDPCQLKLTSWDELQSRSQHMDHVSPSIWKGDVSINTVELVTCWYDGCSQVTSLDQEIKTFLNLLSNLDGIDILSPLGNSIIKFNDQNPISNAESSLEFEDKDDVQDATLHPPSSSICEKGEELDLEDLIGKPDANGIEETLSSFSSYLTIEAQDGTEKTVHKAHTLKVLFEEIIHEKGSTDHQKHIQGLTHYSVKTTSTLDSTENSNSIFGENICVGDPAVTPVVIE